MYTKNDYSIFFKKITLENVSMEYLSWLNDPILNKFTEFKKKKWTKSLLQEFVINSINNNSEYMFCVFDKIDNTHIGNVRLHTVNTDNQTAHIGILIGNKEKTGRGFGTQAISLITQFAFDELKLKEIYAGILKDNIASIKVFEKNKFIKLKSDSREIYSFKLKNNNV